MSELAERLCASVNDHLASLTYRFTEGEASHALTVADGQEIVFPLDAGGGVGGGSAAWVARKHEAGAIHEPGLVAALLAIRDHGPAVRTVLDVGSLYGYHSFLARSLFPGSEVHAFEANPRSYEALQRNIEANRGSFGDSVHAHHCALSDVSHAQTTLHVRAMGLHVPDDGRRRSQTVEVPMWSLDDWCERASVRPDLVKVDVEGYQARIIPGALGTIRAHRPVVLLEFDAPGPANDFGVTNREVIAPLLEDGYSLVWGRHRLADEPFRVLDASDLGDEHEVNSLGVLVPH